MSFKRREILLVIVFIFFGKINVFSQGEIPLHKGWNVGYNLGMTQFYGDGHDRTGAFSSTPLSKFFYQNRSVYNGFYIKKYINDFVGFRGQFSMGKIRSVKESELTYFKTNFFEYTIALELDLDNIFFGWDRRRYWNIYAYAGFGMNDSRTWIYNFNSDVLIRTTPALNNRMLSEGVMPLGLGFKYQIGDNFFINADFSLHGINTDKIDGLISEEKRIEGYGVMSIGINYSFSTSPIYIFKSKYPTYNEKSTDKAIRKYNKKKRVIMKPKARNSNKKFRKPKRTNIFRRIFGR